MAPGSVPQPRRPARFDYLRGPLGGTNCICAEGLNNQHAERMHIANQVGTADQLLVLECYI